MDERAKEIMDQARRTLARVADVRVERRSHDDDGFFSPWSRGIPKKPPPPTRDEVRKMITDAVVELPRSLTPQAAAEVIHEVRQQLRQEAAAEIEKLRAEHDLRLSALLQAVEKLERGIGADRARKDLHSEWMDDCVPTLMSQGKDQIVAVAACLNMWRQAWEETHPDGADDPGPDRPQKSRVVDLPVARGVRHG